MVEDRSDETSMLKCNYLTRPLPCEKKLTAPSELAAKVCDQRSRMRERQRETYTGPSLKYENHVLYMLSV